MKVEYFKYTNIGPRAENQDSLEVISFNESYIACVADGVGGMNCGRIASEKCLSFFIRSIKNGTTDLKEIIELAHKNLKEIQLSRPECKGMATTFTGCILNGGFLTGVHVGDSRLCILRGNGIKQLTEDHTELERFLRSGKIKKEDIENYPRKHILESAIGANIYLKIQTFSFKLVNGDRILITSDGAHDLIKKSEFRDLSKQTKDVFSFGDSIVDLLNSRKLSDNSSFVLMSVE